MAVPSCQIEDVPAALLEQIKRWASVDNKLSVLIAGESGAGKSSLVNTIIGTNAASAGLGPRAIQKDVSCYTRTLHTSVGCIKVLVFDTPGLNDTNLTAEQICSMMVEKTNSCIHVLIYCIDITSRFRRSDCELLINLTKYFGKGIWDHTVFALTKADRALSENQGIDLNPIREEFKKLVHHTLRDTGLSDETLEAIPFALTAAKDDHYIPPECEQGGEDETRNWHWKEQMLLYMLNRVDACAALALLELHQSTLSKFLKDHPYIAGASTFALGTAVLAATGFIGGALAIGTFLALGGAKRSLASTAVLVGGIGVGSKGGSMLQDVVSRKLREWMKTKQE